MAAYSATVPSDSPVGQAKKGAASNVAPIPFARSSKLHFEQGSTGINGIAISGAAPGTFNIPLPSYGYLEAIYLTITAAGGSGVAAVFYEDMPWSIIQSLTLADVNGTPIWQLSGYHAFLASKFGAYRLWGPDTPVAYNAGSTNGNFSFILPIYTGFGKDGLGVLPNMDASARYNLQIVFASGVAAATGPVYTTAPTGYPTLTAQVEVLCRALPAATDMYGKAQSIAPPAVGTTQYWTYQTFPSLNGAQTLQLSRVGNLIRNHILVFRDNVNGTRTTAEASDMPGLFEFDWDTNQRFVANLATLRQTFLSQVSPYNNPSGVLVLPNTLDPDWTIVAENSDQYLATVGATKLTLRFTPTAAVGLTVLTNDIVAASPAIYSAAMQAAA